MDTVPEPPPTPDLWGIGWALLALWALKIWLFAPSPYPSRPPPTGHTPISIARDTSQRLLRFHLTRTYQGNFTIMRFSDSVRAVEATLRTAGGEVGAYPSQRLYDFLTTRRQTTVPESKVPDVVRALARHQTKVARVDTIWIEKGNTPEGYASIEVGLGCHLLPAERKSLDAYDAQIAESIPTRASRLQDDMRGAFDFFFMLVVVTYGAALLLIPVFVGAGIGLSLLGVKLFQYFNQATWRWAWRLSRWLHQVRQRPN